MQRGDDVGGGEAGQHLGARTAERLVGEAPSSTGRHSRSPMATTEDRDDAREGSDLGSERGGEQARRPLIGRGGRLRAQPDDSTVRAPAAPSEFPAPAGPRRYSGRASG